MSVSNMIVGMSFSFFSDLALDAALLSSSEQATSKLKKSAMAVFVNHEFL